MNDPVVLGQVAGEPRAVAAVGADVPVLARVQHHVGLEHALDVEHFVALGTPEPQEKKTRRFVHTIYTVNNVKRPPESQSTSQVPHHSVFPPSEV